MHNGQPFYDPKKSYEANFNEGPFGLFANPNEYINTGEPKEQFMGLPVYLPFGIPAGLLINGKFVEASFIHGYDIAVYKTVRTRQYACHPWPNVLAVKVEGDLTLKKAQQPLVADGDYREPLSITNSFGVPSPDPQFWQEDMKKTVLHAGEGHVVVGSFQGTTSGDGDTQKYIDDFVTAARLVKETGVKVLEANLSCPNEGTAHLLCYDINRTQAITDAIKNEIGETPLILKMAYFEDDDQLTTFVKAVGGMVQGLAAINTIAAPIIDTHGQPALPGKGRERSGVCGIAIQWGGVDMVKRLTRLPEEHGYSFEIIGVGGVMEPDDYLTYREAGADTVMSATGAMWRPSLAIDIKEMLREKQL